MTEFISPDYNGGSIVNLMSSIAKSFGAKNMYPTLRILPPERLKHARNIILIVIDGLGFEFLKKEGKGSFLSRHLAGSMTSVFLPTTAAALTTLLTGVAPQQHAFTGWDMNLKEIGIVCTVLPFIPKFGGQLLSAQGIKMDGILEQESFFCGIKANNFTINPKALAYSEFSKLTSRNSKILDYNSLDEFFAKIKKAVKSGSGKKYVYAYWPYFDSISHKHGAWHKKAKLHLKKMDNKLKRFVKIIAGTKTLLIITADHGLTSTPPERIIWIEDHPKLKECLSLPLCGEGRTAFCYVHPAKARQFEDYVRKNLKKYCHIFRSQELISKNFFGLFAPNLKLSDRIGDYVLVCKENYIIKDKLCNASKNARQSIGHHGGISREEMIVPLILVDC